MTDQGQYDRQKLEYEQKLRAAERAHDRETKLEDMFNENADRHAQAVIRIILVLNGGAAIALLAFVGALASRSTILLLEVGGISRHISRFIFGVIASSVAAMLAYATNFAYTASARFRVNNWEWPYVAETHRSRLLLYTGWAIHLLGILCAMAGLGFFIYGAHKIQRVLGNLK